MFLSLKKEKSITFFQRSDCILSVSREFTHISHTLSLSLHVSFSTTASSVLPVLFNIDMSCHWSSYLWVPSLVFFHWLRLYSEILFLSNLIQSSLICSSITAKSKTVSQLIWIKQLYSQFICVYCVWMFFRLFTLFLAFSCFFFSSPFQSLPARIAAKGSFP